LPSAIPSTPRAFALPLFWAVLAVAAILRFADALRRPLQVDEAYSLHLAALPLAQGLKAVAVLDIHPPLFLIVTHVLAAWHLPDGAFRLLAAAVGVLAVALFYLLVRAWHGDGVAAVAAAGAAVLPSLVFYDTMIRMYGLFDAFALGSFLSLSILYTRDDLRASVRRLLWCVWAVLCAACIATLYLGFLVIAAQLLYTAVLRREHLLKASLGAAAAVLVWSPQLPTFLDQLPRGGLAFPFYAQHLAATILELFGQATIAPQTTGAGVIAIAAGILAWLWVAFALWFGIGGNGRSLALWLGVTGVLTFAYSIIAHKLLYTDRYYLLFAYALCCLTALALARLSAWHPNAGRAAGLAMGMLLGFTGFAYAFDSRLYTADWPAIGTVLQSGLRGGDVVIMEQGSSFFPLERGPWLDHHPLLLTFHRSDVDQAARLARPFARVWLVLFQAAPVDPDLRLANGLRRERRPAGMWEFVRWLPAESASVLLFQRAAQR